MPLLTPPEASHVSRLGDPPAGGEVPNLAETALRRERERFQMVTEAAQVGIWFCDLPFDVLIWDARVKEHFWLSPEAEVTIDTFYARLHPEDRERTQRAIEQSITDKSQYDIEYRTVSDTREEKWIRAIGRGFYNDAGNPIRFDGVTLDITAVKRNEKALRESRERLQASLDAAEAGTFRWDLQTGGLDWDGNLDALFGLSPGQTVRSLENFISMVHPEERAGVAERCRHCAEEGTDFEMQFRVIWPDGSIHWLHDKGRAFFDENGKPLYMTGACVEITTQKHIEAAFRESSERFRTMADNISQLAWMAEPDGHISWFNRRWFEYTGTTLDTMQGAGWIKVHHPDHLERVLEKWWRQIRAGDSWEDTLPLAGADGQYRWFLSRAVPIRDEKGRVQRWFGTHTDVNDRELAQGMQSPSSFDLS
jgi:PAS domain S-box-containing protein